MDWRNTKQGGEKGSGGSQKSGTLDSRAVPRVIGNTSRLYVMVSQRRLAWKMIFRRRGLLHVKI